MSGLVVVLVGGLVAGLALVFGLGLVVGLVGGLGIVVGVGLIHGLRTGMGAYVQHQLLRRALARLGLLPPRLTDFLDFAASQVLLQRVGGGYRFVHALLLDYFADQWPDLSAIPPKGSA